MTLLIDALRAAIFTAAHLLGGSLGAGVLAVSATLRLALLPLTLTLARRARAQQRLLKSIRPDVTALTTAYAKQPDELWRLQLALYRRTGYRPFDPAGLFGGLAQVPILGGLYGALRRGLGAAAGFFWIADLGRPDALLASAVALTAAIAAWLGADPAVTTARSQAVMATVGAAVTLAVCWHASSALALSWGASSLVNAVQGAILRREDRRR